jgi:carbon monoxide dehydrogenase subunit G
MVIDLEVQINAPKEPVWDVITDIENSDSTIAAIEKLEILEKPASGLVGFKWRETRTMFGKTATEVMWITEATTNECYKVRAESHGSIYVTTMALWDNNGHTQLSMKFEISPQTFVAKLMWATTGMLFKGATKKALMQDLENIKAVIERNR